MKYEFDIERVIGLSVVERSKTSYGWLPRKQKTLLFGLIKLNKYYPEGYYSSGCYEQCYESGCYEADSYSADELRKYGYIVNDIEKKVYNKPYVKVYLESEYNVTAKFETESEAEQWAQELKLKTGKNFEIIKT